MPRPKPKAPLLARAHAAIAPGTRLRNIMTTTGGVVALIGALWTADEHWARASDMRQFAAVTSSALEINRLTSEVSVLEIRQATVKDRLRASMREPKPTQNTRASIEEDRAEAAQLDAEIAAKRQLIDKLRTGK